MRFDKKVVLRNLTALSAALALSLVLSSCSQHRYGVAGPVVAVVYASAPPSVSSSAPLEFSSAVRALKLGHKAEAASMLARVGSEHPGTIWAGRSSFLSGVLAVEKGEAGAIAMFEGADALKEAIPDYLALYRARAYAIDNDHDKAIAALDSLINDYPSSSLVPEALFLRSSYLMDSGRNGEAADAFEAIASSRPESSMAARALLKAAEAHLGLGNNMAAAALIKKIYVDYPADKAAVSIKNLIERRPEGVADLTPVLTPAERYGRAQRLFRKARFDEASREYSVLSSDPRGSFYDSSVIKRAVSMVRLKRYDEARSILDGYLLPATARSAEMESEALYWSALVSLRQGQEQGLLSAVGRLASKHPQSKELASTLVLLGRHYESRGMDAEAIGAYARVMDGFAGSAPAREAAWNTGWRHYRAGRYDKAISVFSLKAAPEPGGEEMFLYWRARSLERMGDIDEAARLYRLLCAASSRDYYCRMAEKRLVAGGGGQERTGIGSPEQAPPVEKARFEGASPAFFSGARYIAAMELLTLGLDARAAEETEKLAREHSKDPGALVELAGLYYRAGDFNRASRLYYSYLSGFSSGPPGLPDLRTFSFPPGLVELVRRKSSTGPSGSPRSVDPYLVAAVMREESGFNPGAVSSTGALGLMQIMPSTGRFIAGKLGRELDDKRELLDPDVSIELGSWYLGHLARRFDNDIVLTIASYNAGPTAVARWTETLPAELDEFIESIPYPETRRYAKKVLKSYGEFLRVGGVDPSGLFTRPVLDAVGPAASPAEIEAQADKDDGQS